MPVTVEQLKAIMPNTRHAEDFFRPLNNAMEHVEINTPLRTAMFLAQIAHESQELNRVLENLNYGAPGLLATFKGRFTPAQANDYARQPERIANRAYADKLGNGNEASGDGWRYRGRGLIQVTGKDNYADCARTLNIDLVASPAFLETPEFAAQSAAWYWRKRDINEPADAGDVKEATKRINAKLLGLAERTEFFTRAKQILRA